MNITPKNVFKGTNSDGTTFTVREWDYKTLNNIEGGVFLIGLVAGLVFCSIVSPLLIIVTIKTFKRKLALPSIIGLFFSLYFIIDYSHTWLVRLALNIFCDESTVKTLFIINIIALITHILLMIAVEINNVKAKRNENQNIK